MSIAELEADVEAVDLPDPDEHDIIRAETDGLPPVDDDGHGGEEAIVVAASEAQPEKSDEPVTSGPEWQLQQIEEVNESVLKQQDLVDRMAKDLKVERGELEARQKQLNRLISEIAEARKAGEPDPARYPLLDKPREATDADKAAINSQFRKPEAIPPEPANLEAFQRMRSEATTLESLKLGKRALAKLEGQGITTAAHLYGKDPKALGLTEKQADEVESVMSLFWDACGDAWRELHPDEPEPRVDVVAEQGGNIHWQLHPAEPVTGTAIGDDGDDDPGREEAYVAQIREMADEEGGAE